MKTASALRASYDRQRPGYDALRSVVDDLLRRSCADRRWHYESRVKELVSYALKVETGRVSALDGVDDFFAASIVVRNGGEIESAVALVETIADIQFRRPKDPALSPHRPASFEFDDLRLYVKLKEQPGMAPGPEVGLLFEVQVKTFLFHAWAIATHDLTYKADDVSWGRERLAAQVRAMLEQAEITIQGAGALSSLGSLARENNETKVLRQVIRITKDTWISEQLPSDVRRLAGNILTVLKAIEVSVERWVELLSTELLTGPLPLSENPYQVTVRLLLQSERQAVERFAVKNGKQPKLVIYSSAELPAWIEDLPARNIIRV